MLEIKLRVLLIDQYYFIKSVTDPINNFNSKANNLIDYTLIKKCKLFRNQTQRLNFTTMSLGRVHSSTRTQKKIYLQQFS